MLLLDWILKICASVHVFMLTGIKSKVQFFLQAIGMSCLPSIYRFNSLAERLVASASSDISEDVLLCASLLQRSDQHFRAVSLLSRFPDAASSARGKIVLAQSHAALGDWDSVKVADLCRSSLSRLSCALLRLCWTILAKLGPSVCFYQVSSHCCFSSSSMFHLASSLADDVPLDRPAAADIALSFTLLAQAVCLFALFCRRHVVKHCFQGCQPRGPQWRSAASATGSAS